MEIGKPAGPQLKIGQPFDPQLMIPIFDGVLCIPESLANRLEVSSSAKLAWAWMAKHANGKDDCSVDFEELAKGIGLSVNESENAAGELEKKEF